MQTLLRLLALVAIVLSIPACASAPKKSSCCSSSGHMEKGKCAAGDASCKAPTKKKAS
jgi:hypothetical protein